MKKQESLKYTEDKPNYSNEATIKDEKLQKKNVITVLKEASLFLMLDENDEYRLTYGNTVVSHKKFNKKRDAIDFLETKEGVYTVVPLMAAIMFDKITKEEKK